MNEALIAKKNVRKNKQSLAFNNKIFNLAVISFLIAFYLVQFSPWSSAGVAKHNDGYGTFDMNSYDSATVTQVLSGMDQDGIHAEQVYYVVDYIFILAIGILQVLLFKRLYYNLPYRILEKAGIVSAVLRGIFDALENAFLLIIICDFPKKHNSLIQVSSVVTKLKLTMVALWAIISVLGIILRAIKKPHEISSK